MSEPDFEHVRYATVDTSTNIMLTAAIALCKKTSLGYFRYPPPWNSKAIQWFMLVDEIPGLRGHEVEIPYLGPTWAAAGYVRYKLELIFN